ncbi:MAG: pilus assembly protein PilM [Patescibacteria group bacterium]
MFRRIAVDIGTSEVRVCELERGAGTMLRLSRFGLKEYLLDPLADEADKRAKKRQALEELLAEMGIGNRLHFWRQPAVVGVPGRSVFTRTRFLPPIPRKRIDKIVRYELQQQIPFKLDQIRLGYHLFPTTDTSGLLCGADAKEKGYQVMMAAIKRDALNAHLAPLPLELVNPIACIPASVALYDWLRHIGELGHADECVAVLDLGANTTNLVIERGGQFAYTRPLHLAGNDVTAAIGNAFGVPFLEAEAMKLEQGFVPTSDVSSDGKMGEATGPVLSRLVTEVKDSLAYFRSLPGGGEVDRFLLTGGGVRLRNIALYFQRAFGREVRLVDPLAGMSSGSTVFLERPYAAATVLGLALAALGRAEININLA